MKLSTEALSGPAKAAKDFVELGLTNRQELIRAVKALPPTQLLQKIAVGAPIGVAALTALPVFGAVGALTATGVAVGATIGAVAALTEEVMARREASSTEEKNG